MRIPFRQGIVRHQQDPQGAQQFLLEQSSSIDLIVENDPTIVAFAHKTRNYIITEKRSVPNAWTGPFVNGTDYWLFWDVNLVTGLRTFGHTTLEPVVSAVAPVNPQVDQHWFDTSTMMMKVFNGASFKERVRVFASKYANATLLTSFSGGTVFKGTQVANSTKSSGGALIFDDADKPLKRGDGTFITTADEFSSGVATASNIKIEALTFEANASANIAAYHIVYLNDFNSVLPATPLNIHNVPFGIIEEDAYVGELVNITTDGVICNPNWNWQTAGAEIFIDEAGQIQDVSVPGMLPIGYVLSPSEILLKTSGVTQVTIEGDIIGGGGTDGAETLPELNDVDIDSATDGQVLTFEETEIGSHWVNRDLPVVSVDVTGLADTVITNPQFGDTLSFQEGDIWVNGTQSAPVHALGDHSNVIEDNPQNGQVLTFVSGEIGNEWVNMDLPVAPTPTLGINNLIDVYTEENMALGQVLTVVNGEGGFEWANVNLPAAPTPILGINNLIDVYTEENMALGQVLTVVNGEGGFEWANVNLPTAPTPTLSLNNMQDVRIDDGLLVGQVLSLVNGEGGFEWANVTLPSGGGGGLTKVQDDTNPILGGDLSSDNYNIVMVNNSPVAKGISFTAQGSEVAHIETSPDASDFNIYSAFDMKIRSTQDITITPGSNKYLMLDGIKWPIADGTSGQTMVTDGAGNLSFATAASGGGASYLVDLLDVISSTNEIVPSGHVLTYLNDTWVDAALPVIIPEVPTVITLEGITDGANISVDAMSQWTTINLTANTVLSFNYGTIPHTEAVEFTVEIYPGTNTVTWPAGVIGDLTITPSVVNLFTVVRRPTVAGMLARTYVLKVLIPNDINDPLAPLEIIPIEGSNGFTSILAGDTFGSNLNTTSDRVGVVLPTATSTTSGTSAYYVFNGLDNFTDPTFIDGGGNTRTHSMFRSDVSYTDNTKSVVSTTIFNFALAGENIPDSDTTFRELLIHDGVNPPHTVVRSDMTYRGNWVAFPEKVSLWRLINTPQSNLVAPYILAAKKNGLNISVQVVW